MRKRGVYTRGRRLAGGLGPVTQLFSLFLLFYLILGQDPNATFDIVVKWAVINICLSLLVIVGAITESYNFALGGQHLVRNLRHRMMRKLVSQEIGYFDFDENSAGELTQFLAEKVSKVSSLSGKQLSDIAKLVAMLLITLLLMFIYGHWSIALVCIGLFPFTMVALMAIIQVRARCMPMDAHFEAQSPCALVCIGGLA